MTELDQFELRMPISGCRLQWRAETQSWRYLASNGGEGGETAALSEADASPWMPWTKNSDGGMSSAFQKDAYERDVSWWLVFGELDAPDCDVSVTLTDGTSPAIARLGPLFAAEWVSVAQQATVSRNGLALAVDFHRPSVMVAGMRYKNRPSANDGGWVR